MSKDVLGQRMLTETQIRQILAGFAAALYRQAEAEKNKQAGKEAGADDLCFQKLLGGLAPDFTEECRKDPELISGAVDFSAISASVRFVPYEDFLGFAYLSLKSLSGRKTAGAYYTPVSVAQRLVAGRFRTGSGFLLRPGTGSGSLLRLRKYSADVNEAGD